MINCTNIESCDSKRCLLGDSTDGDSDNNNEDVDQEVLMHVALKPYMPTTDPTLDAPPCPFLDPTPATSTNATLLCTPAIDNYRGS